MSGRRGATFCGTGSDTAPLNAAGTPDCPFPVTRTHRDAFARDGAVGGPGGLFPGDQRGNGVCIRVGTAVPESVSQCPSRHRSIRVGIAVSESVTASQARHELAPQAEGGCPIRGRRRGSRRSRLLGPGSSPHAAWRGFWVLSESPIRVSGFSPMRVSYPSLGNSGSYPSLLSESQACREKGRTHAAIDELPVTQAGRPGNRRADTASGPG